LAAVAKRVAGVARERRLPAFARQTFTDWYRHRPPASRNGLPVILWPDTFNNYFHPHIAEAACVALEQAGCVVKVPGMHVCCGRPLYEWGMLARARRYLEHVMDVLGDDIRAGTPVIGLEPACVSVFREELTNLFPVSEQAKRLSKQTLLLSEFLATKAPRFPFGKIHRRAIVHGHCHHQSVLKMGAEREVLQRLGLDFDILDSGCCGMAGSFGFEKSKYDVSMKCGERVLLPAVRHAEADTLIVANGFSCREQIVQTTDREPLHLAEVLALAAGDPQSAQP
jgi:Fe-S oxidoreductase